MKRISRKCSNCFNVPFKRLSAASLSIHDRATVNDITGVLNAAKTCSGGINATNADMQTALHLAAHEGHVGLVQTILSKGGSVTARDIYGWTALHFACASASESCIEVARSILIDGRAKACVTTDSGGTPLHYLVRDFYGNMADLPGLINLLIAGGCELDARNKHGDTPLIQSCARGNVNVIRLLLEMGADMQVRAKGGETALHVAIRGKNVEVAKLLIEKGADVEAKTLEGVSCRSYSIRFSVDEVHAFIVAKFGEQAFIGQEAEEGTVAVKEELVKLMSSRGYDSSEVMAAIWQLHARKAEVNVASVEREVMDSLMDKTGCKICMDAKVNCVLFPCKHSCMCMECASAVVRDFQCPICRQQVDDVVKIYVC